VIGAPKRSVVLAGVESCLIATAVTLGSYVRIGDATWRMLQEGGGVLRVMLVAVVCQICLHYADLYDLRATSGLRDVLLGLVQALGASSFILALLYFWFPQLIIGRGVFVISVVFVIVLVAGWRFVFTWLSRRTASERLLIVGTNPAAVELARELFARREELGVEIVGFVDSDPAKYGMPVLNPGVVGTLDDIPGLVTALDVDRVVVSLSDARGQLPMHRLLDIRLGAGVVFDHLASVYEEYTGKIAVENLRPSWLIFSEGFRKTRISLELKRALDLVLSLVGLVVALPLMLLIALAITLTSPGPVLYHQERVGLNGRRFMLHKFRTMVVDAEASTGPVWSRPNDRRVTPIGRLLRRTRLDEVPQLWNVLRGEMSFVGPRPERPGFVEQLTAQIPFYGLRHSVKPGITGWAQVRYTYGASVEDAVEKLQYDLFYIKNMSIALDVVILLETAKTVLLGRGGR